MFVFSINPQTQLKEVVVNPKMNEKSLQEIVETTRKLIVELYLKCEDDFLKGLEIFEAIVEKQILDTSKEQIKELETTIESTLQSPTAPEPAVIETAVIETPVVEPTIVETTSPEPAAIEVVAKEETPPEVSSSPVDVEAETELLEEQMLAAPDISREDTEMRELALQLKALGGGSPRGVIVGGTKYI
jgi:hypothetical protein